MTRSPRQKPVTASATRKILNELISESGSELERAFDTQLARLGQDLPKPIPHFRFDNLRKWEVDRAWPEFGLAVEIEGGSHGFVVVCHNCHEPVRALKRDGTPGRVIRAGGWHGRHDRFLTDMKKYNALGLAGFHLLRFGSDDINGDPMAMIEDIRRVIESRRSSVPLVEALTPRETQALYLVAGGFRTREIAERLGVGEHGVRSYVEDLCQKLCVSNRMAAVARAITWGIINPEKIPFADDADILPDLEDPE